MVMNIKQMMIKALRHTKWVPPQSVDEEKWYEACDKAIELVEQLKEPDETKMNLKDLERANTLVENVKILETLSKSEIEHLRVTYPDGRGDCIYMKDELKEKIRKVFEDCAEESKAELQELGVEYENN
jgi:predicted RNase H-like nuclease (RuvC/YqgF family)